ncbi:MinD/ParA family ATP-binding protein [Actinomadura gamaensis]|uniref:AAA family ATPase n=1 Tax=Actinomadura gamaensis TaxID=1763541 RepID=A0ABV9U9K5_9ACTN
MQGEAPWGAPPATGGSGEQPAQDGFPGVAAQQDAQQNAQPLSAPPAASPDGGWGQPGGNDDPSGFPGVQGQGPEAGRPDGATGQPGAGQPGAGQPEPLLHSDFAWEAAINPVLGGTEQQDEAQAREQQQAAQAQQQQQQPVPGPQQQAPQAAAGGPHPADELVRKNVHGDKLGRRLGRGMRKAVGGGSAMTAQQQAAFADLMARPVPSFRQIAVASVRGGAGKTTMAALLASELARNRQDRVVAIDADAELGSLPLRLGLVPQLSLTELAQANPATFDEVSRFLTRTPDGLWVLSSTRGGRMSQEFSIQTFQRALSSVSRFVSAAVVDCGAGILTEVNQGVIAQTHALVLVTPGTVDGALSARGALEWFANNGRQHVFQRAVVVMVSHAPQINADLGRAQEMLTAWGLPVVHVPYDRHVATGAALDLDKIGGATRQATTKIVYQAFARSLGLPGVAG